MYKEELQKAHSIHLDGIQSEAHSFLQAGPDSDILVQTLFKVNCFIFLQTCLS